MNILLATNNRHKAEELRSILLDVNGISVVQAAQLGLHLGEPVEDGKTLEENAFIKASEIYNATGLPTISDDTGLEVAVLNGEPGVYSARYAGESASYEDNCNALLKAMKNSKNNDRSARFRTVICYRDDLRTILAEGFVDGEITETFQGKDGFGYDPLFRPKDSDKTFAEMSSEEKNSVSHRARALIAFRKELERMLEHDGGMVE